MFLKLKKVDCYKNTKFLTMRIEASAWAVVLCAYACMGEKWRWPEGAESVRIDNKVRFIDTADRHDKPLRNSNVEADEAQFEEPTNTEGFYNLPPGVGRYPVRVETNHAQYKVDPSSVYNLRRSPQQQYSDGTLDSIQFCKCVSTQDCRSSLDPAVSQKACGLGKHLCCYKRPGQSPLNSEYFNEVDDERPSIEPEYIGHGGAFPPPPGALGNDNFRPDRGHKTVGGLANKQILVGPGGPTGNIGPAQNFGQQQGILVGPEGPTGMIGNKNNQLVLVGPEGPTGIIGPAQQNPGVLVGPGGPTGVIGPAQPQYYKDRTVELGSSETAQRGILVGPGGPTGFIGPGGYGRRPVLVGPGGPTGIIGPYGQRPGRPVLVGPGGPTGIIGPRRRPYYGK